MADQQIPPPTRHFSRRVLLTGMATAAASGYYMARSGTAHAPTAHPPGNQIESLPATSAASTEASPQRQQAAKKFTSALTELTPKGGLLSISGTNIRTGRTVNFRESDRYITASVIKVDLLTALLLKHQDDGTSLSSAEKKDAKAMICASDNDAADDIWKRVGGASTLKTRYRQLSMPSSIPNSNGSWGLSTTTATDRRMLMTTLLNHQGPLNSDGRTYAADLMNQVIQEQRWGVSTIFSSPTCRLKNGWLPYSRGWVMHSTGWGSLANGDTAALAIMTRGSTSMGRGIDAIESAARLCAADLMST